MINLKNSKYFPFERNHYFYGKLLSVDDFELEQRYMNDKRRMINRFIHGSGIVAGLYVVGIDEQTISIESGFALDSLGREIVVDVPVIKKLSLIEGFDACIESEQLKYAYLCLKYNEKEENLVHNITKSTSREADYSKIKEEYQLYLSTQEPDAEDLSISDLYEETKTIYWEEDIHIRQIMPRYVQTKETVTLRIEIENIGRKTLSFSYDLILTCLLYHGQSKVKVTFDEVLFERTGTYTISYELQAADFISAEGMAVVDPESVQFQLSGESKSVTMEGKSIVMINKQEESRQLIKHYYRSAMEKIMQIGYHQPIYLAKIFMIKAGDSFMIDRIETVPFRQYVMNNMLSSAIDQLWMREFEKQNRESKEDSQDSLNGKKQEQKEQVQIKKGSCIINLGTGGQRGERFFSEEIIHELGVGAVTVWVGLEKEEGEVTYGSSEVFEKKGIDAEIAANLSLQKGSFIIGIRLLSPTIQEKVKVYWTAIRDKEEVNYEKSNRRILIKPSILELYIRESHYLEAVCENMMEKKVKWMVKENGGTIDQNGMYTAPNTPGVYEVVAQSIAIPEITASIFIVVRQKEE